MAAIIDQPLLGMVSLFITGHLLGRHVASLVWCLLVAGVGVALPPSVLNICRDKKLVAEYFALATLIANKRIKLNKKGQLCELHAPNAIRMIFEDRTRTARS